MKRDWLLIRKLLLGEDLPHYSDSEVDYHVGILVDAGMMDVERFLTYKGDEWADLLTDESELKAVLFGLTMAKIESASSEAIKSAIEKYKAIFDVERYKTPLD